MKLTVGLEFKNTIFQALIDNKNNVTVTVNLDTKVELRDNFNKQVNRFQASKLEFK